MEGLMASSAPSAASAAELLVDAIETKLVRGYHFYKLSFPGIKAMVRKKLATLGRLPGRLALQSGSYKSSLGPANPIA